MGEPRLHYLGAITSQHAAVISPSSIPNWLVPGFGLPAVIFLVGLAVDSEGLRVVSKSLPVLALAVAVGTARPRIRYRSLVAAALLLGAAGDFLLEVDLFIYGLLIFLIGHVFYISAFLGDDLRIGLREAFPFLAWGVALVAIVANGVGDLLLPVAVYAAVLCAMMWRALTRMRLAPAFTGRATAIGAVLFGVSDSIIALDRFGSEIRFAPLLIIVTYWAAQALLALGALRHST